MIIKIYYTARDESLEYYDWITETGISCIWNFDNQNHMIIDFRCAEDATAFRLRFGV